MSFYTSYLEFLQQAHDRTRNGPKYSQALDSLFQHLHFPDQTVKIEEIESLLEELKFVKEWSSSPEGEDFSQTVDILFVMFLSELKIDPKQVTPLLAEKWLKANMDLGWKLLIDLGWGAWLEADPKRRLYRPFTEYKDQKPCPTLLSTILRRSLSLGIVPPQSWYQSIDELKLLNTPDSLLQLALSDGEAFQALDINFPGYLFYYVPSFEQLSTFCQLLPQTFRRLLHAPQVHSTIPNIVEYVRILIKIVNISCHEKNGMVAKAIKSLDDLVAVVTAFPHYTSLLIDENIPAALITSANIQQRYKPGVCMHYIKTIEDLLRFDLSNLSLQKIVNECQELRLLAGTSKLFVDESVASLDRFKSKTKPLPNSTTILDPRLLSYGRAIHLMQYSDDAGYYSTGNVAFSDGVSDGDFYTEASNGWSLALSLSFRAFQIWQQLSREPSITFEILECGAGDGDLCLKMLTFIQDKARDDKEWAAFYRAIHYTIVELAAALVQRQGRKLASFIAQNKVEVIKDNALTLSKYNKVASLYISNELEDMFEAEELVVSREGEYQVTMLVPYLTLAGLKYFQQNNPEVIAGIDEESSSFADLLKEQKVSDPHEGLPLIAGRFTRLMAITSRKEFKGPKECFLFSKFTLPLTYFPGITKYLAKHEEILIGMFPGDSKIICPVMDEHARLLNEKSRVRIIIDYGEITYNIKNLSYRFYGDKSPDYMHTLCSPGKVDATYDVDFTTLVTELERLTPDGLSSMFVSGQLMPHNMELPAEYSRLCNVRDQAEFKRSEFLGVLSTAPGVNLELTGMAAKPNCAVTKDQLALMIAERANITVKINQRAAKETAVAKGITWTAI